MDLENQKRVKDFAEKFGPENLVVVLGAAEGEAASLAAETVTAAADGAIAATQAEHYINEWEE